MNHNRLMNQNSVNSKRCNPIISKAYSGGADGAAGGDTDAGAGAGGDHHGGHSHGPSSGGGGSGSGGPVAGGKGPTISEVDLKKKNDPTNQPTNQSHHTLGNSERTCEL